VQILSFFVFVGGGGGAGDLLIQSQCYVTWPVYDVKVLYGHKVCTWHDLRIQSMQSLV